MKTTKNDPTFIKMWIDNAKSDLKAAKTLYAKRQYRASFSSFQQASEKAGKAYTLYLGIADERDLYKAQHDLMKIVKKLVQSTIDVTDAELKELQSLADEEKPMSKIQELEDKLKMIDDGKNEMDEFKKRDFTKLTIEELDDLLKEPWKSIFSKMALPKKYGTVARSKIESAIKWVENKNAAGIQPFRKLYEDQETFKDSYPFIAPIVNLLAGLYFCPVVFGICAYVTYGHHSKTRYPQNGQSPLKIYTLKLPIVQKQPEFMNLLGQALSRFTFDTKS